MATRTTSQRRSAVGGFLSKTSLLIASCLVALVLLNLFHINPIGGLRDWLFGTEHPPESADATLLTLQATKDLRAATGDFQVPVTFGQEQDGILHKLPDFLDGNSGMALYQGTVDAYVSLEGLTGADLVVDEEARTLVVTVPAPRLSEPNINEDKSKIVTQSRGVFTRLGDVFNDDALDFKTELDRVAKEQLKAAAAESSLDSIARQTTTEFLSALAKRLGYEEVQVKFREPQSP